MAARALRGPPFSQSDRGRRAATSMRRLRRSSPSSYGLEFWAALKPKLGSASECRRAHGTPSEAREQRKRARCRAAGNRDRTWPPGSGPKGKLKGTPEVIDTPPLPLQGKLLRLFGVEWVRGTSRSSGFSARARVGTGSQLPRSVPLPTRGARSFSSGLVLRRRPGDWGRAARAGRSGELCQAARRGVWQGLQTSGDATVEVD